MVNIEPYMVYVNKTIESNWKPAQTDKSTTIIVAFTIAKDGNLLGIEIAKSSHVRDLDRAAMEAVKRSAPFKPLPPDVEYSALNVRFTFELKVQAENY